jgi:hypothetical protein
VTSSKEAMLEADAPLFPLSVSSSSVGSPVLPYGKGTPFLYLFGLSETEMALLLVLNEDSSCIKRGPRCP